MIRYCRVKDISDGIARHCCVAKKMLNIMSTRTWYQKPRLAHGQVPTISLCPVFIGASLVVCTFPIVEKKQLRNSSDGVCYPVTPGVTGTILHVQPVFITPVAPVVQVVNVEFYLFESWVRAPGGSDLDFICKNKKKESNC